MNVKLLISGAIIVALVGFFVYSNRYRSAYQYPAPTSTPMAVTNSSPSAQMNNQIEVNLAAQNSTESGKAVIKDLGGKVSVELTLSGTPPSVGQPAHIHSGACPKPGNVVYPLKEVINGKSETFLNISLSDIKAALPLAINVHKSAAEVSTYVACGDIH